MWAPTARVARSIEGPVQRAELELVFDCFGERPCHVAELLEKGVVQGGVGFDVGVDFASLFERAAHLAHGHEQ